MKMFLLTLISAAATAGFIDQKMNEPVAPDIRGNKVQQTLARVQLAATELARAEAQGQLLARERVELAERVAQLQAKVDADKAAEKSAWDNQESQDHSWHRSVDRNNPNGGGK
jgi:hypothetical protein